jgi:outer membrane biogenesis lipoprotein LolB
MRISFIRIVSLLIVALFLVACSSVTPESQLSEINELLSKKYPMRQEQARDITAFTDAGKKLMQEGKNAEASEKLAEALKILYWVRDTDVLNKSD